MLDRFAKWVGEALNGKQQEHGPERPHETTQDCASEGEFNLEEHAPEFTVEDERIAHSEGFFDALDRWKWMVGGQLATLGREKIKMATKAQVEVDLESEGLSFDELGQVSDESIHLPLQPDYVSQREIYTPKEPYLRHAHFVGMCNRLIDIKGRLAKYGLSEDLSEDEMPGRHADVYHWAQHEYARLSERFAALGKDIEDVERRIEEGEIVRQDMIDLPDEELLDPDNSRYRISTAPLERDKETERQYDRHTGTESSGAPSFHQQSRSSSGPQVHVKEYEMAMLRERLGQINDLMSALGYDWDTETHEVRAQDRQAFRQLIREHRAVESSLAELCEELDQVEKEIKEEQAPRNLDEGDDERHAEDSNEEEDSERAEDPSSREDAGETDVRTEAGAEESTDPWSVTQEGWDGAFDGFGYGE